jgi:abortive infection bacteriophage resistance protein
MRYPKPALSFADQVKLLESRKLIVEDRAEAEDVLSHISYFRLSAYFRPFRKSDSEEFNGATFNDILLLYKFDKHLRLLISDVLESIEVHFRTRITYHLALRGGAFAHINPSNFLPGFDHLAFLAQIKEMEAKSSDKFVAHFQGKYISESHLPIWMATELMPFGFLSRVYSSLTYDIQREVADDIGVHRSVLIKSWLHTLSYVRNVCASWTTLES